MSKNILHFVKKYWPAAGGIQTHVHELSKAQAASSNVQSVHIATLGDGELIEKKADYPVTGHLISSSDRIASTEHIVNHTVNSIPVSYSLKRIVNKFNIDVVHVHDLPFELIPFVNYMNNMSSDRVDIVTTVHSSYFLNNRGTWKDYLFKNMLEQSCHVIAPSNEIKSEVRELINTDRINSLSYISNGVPAQFFTDTSGVSTDQYTILCPRRLYPKNGVIHLAKSMKFLDQYLDSFEVVFAGSGPEREEIVRTIEADNQMRNANFRGEVDYEEMPELYSSADVSVFPSLKEATSIAALESMASGTPVVATNVGGLTQIIENGREGLLVDPAQPDEIASAVDKLLKSNQYDEYQRNAKQRAENNSWEKMVDEKLPY